MIDTPSSQELQDQEAIKRFIAERGVAHVPVKHLPQEKTYKTGFRRVPRYGTERRRRTRR